MITKNMWSRFVIIIYIYNNIMITKKSWSCHSWNPVKARKRANQGCSSDWCRWCVILYPKNTKEVRPRRYLTLAKRNQKIFFWMTINFLNCFGPLTPLICHDRSTAERWRLCCRDALVQVQYDYYPWWRPSFWNYKRGYLLSTVLLSLIVLLLRPADAATNKSIILIFYSIDRLLHSKQHQIA